MTGSFGLRSRPELRFELLGTETGRIGMQFARASKSIERALLVLRSADSRAVSHPGVRARLRNRRLARALVVAERLHHILLHAPAVFEDDRPVVALLRTL